MILAFLLPGAPDLVDEAVMKEEFWSGCCFDGAHCSSDYTMDSTMEVHPKSQLEICEVIRFVFQNLCYCYHIRAFSIEIPLQAPRGISLLYWHETKFILSEWTRLHAIIRPFSISPETNITAVPKAPWRRRVEWITGNSTPVPISCGESAVDFTEKVLVTQYIVPMPWKEEGCLVDG